MPLIAADEPGPAIVHNAGAAAPFVFICDHAGREIPRALGDLGLPPPAFDRHIAWDIGAAALTLRLAEAFDACAILQRYSRLVIDCNRTPGRPDAIPAASDGQAIPGNVGLAPADAAARVHEIHAPYHEAITRELDARTTPPKLVFVHSFTPRMNGLDRPWRYGVLHLGGSPFSDAMLRLLHDEPAEVVGEAVGDNAPYRMDETDHTCPRHAIARGLDYLELEVRQDLIADATGQARVSAVLERLLPRAAASA